MTAKLLKHIFRILCKAEWTTLPFGLKGGKIGIMLFVALYSEYTKNVWARNLSIRMLQDILKNKTIQHYTLISGKLGTAWALHLLYRKGILERNGALNEILTSIRMKYTLRYASAPYQIIEDDNLFSAGIYTLVQHPNDNTLERYQIEERLISLVDECERQLSQEFITFYFQSNRSPYILHSYIFFYKHVSKNKFSLIKQIFCLYIAKKSMKKRKKICLCTTILFALSSCIVRHRIFHENYPMRNCSN